MSDIRAFPNDRSPILWEKIDQLIQDPLPDGKTKKKLKGATDLYRLRVGDHRVFYRFGADWVSLLGVRRRNERTYSQMPGVESAVPPPEDDGDDDLDALLDAARPTAYSWRDQRATSPLPVRLTPDWLNEHGIPPEAHPPLMQCRTEDDLLDAPVAQDLVTRVLDALFPPNLTTVDQQPDLVVPSAEHLVRYAEGDLITFLLRLDDDQRRLASWALVGPTLIKGGAGTGKSTVALHRVKAVLERPGASGRETVLFTTYTNALLEVTRQLLAQLLTPDQYERVRVATVDQLVREIVALRRPLGRVESDSEARRRLRALRAEFSPTAESAFEVRLRARALDRLSDRYLLEEFQWIIEGRGLGGLDAYLTADRTGRGVAFPERVRRAVWALYERFAATATAERFSALRVEALALAAGTPNTPKWDHVIVDEAQDLSGSALALMMRLARSPSGLLFAADDKQSIYSRSRGWKAAAPALKFRGRTAVLRRNYRSTAAIDRAAFALLDSVEGEELEPSESVHDGPLPVLVRHVEPAAEAAWIARFVRQMARHLRLKTSAAAVLVPTRAIGEGLATAIDDEGLRAAWYAGREIDLAADVVKVLTLHSAKGLEFPIVVVAGLYDGTYPLASDYDDPDLYRERMRHQRRLLYVGATRAMRALMLVVHEGTRHAALLDLDTQHWHVEDAR